MNAIEVNRGEEDGVTKPLATPLDQDLVLINVGDGNEALGDRLERRQMKIAKLKTYDVHMAPSTLNQVML